MIRNPFSIYDLLGFLIPGIIFLFFFFILLEHTAVSNTEGFIYYLKKSIQLIINKETSYSFTFFFIISFISCAYIAGHCLNFLSAITIEQYSIWALGYPTQYLLIRSRDNTGYFKNTSSHGNYNSSITPYYYIVRLLVAIIISPISILDQICGKKMKLRDLYAFELSDIPKTTLSEKIKKFVTAHALDYEGTSVNFIYEADYFQYTYHYALESAPNHIKDMLKDVALYRLLRTMALFSVIAFWASVPHLFLGENSLSLKIFYTSTSFFLSYLFFMIHSKFYRYFGLGVLMAMAVAHTREEKNLACMVQDCPKQTR